MERDPDAYSPEELVDDVYREVWKGTIAGRQLTREEIMIQQSLLGSIAVTSQAGAPAGTFETAKAIGIERVNKTPEEILAFLNDSGLLENWQYNREPENGEKLGFFPMWPGIQANRYSSAALFYDMLLRTRDLIRGTVGNAKGETKKHYEFMLYKIDKMLTNK